MSAEEEKKKWKERKRELNTEKARKEKKRWDARGFHYSALLYMNKIL
jgi:hypothetical protein